MFLMVRKECVEGRAAAAADACAMEEMMVSV